MRKVLFMSALASAALVGCVNDEAMENTSNANEPQPISFNAPVVDGLTRAVTGEITDVYPTTEKFNVYALWHKNEFTSWKSVDNESSVYMKEVTVANTTYDTTNEGSTGWSTEEDATVYYWPKEGYLTFAAYSPADAKSDGTFAMTETGLSITEFKVKDDASNHYDLLFSDLTKNQKSDAYTDTSDNYDGVDIKFKHALSAIRFKVKTKEDYSTSATITLTGISISGINYQGTFTQNLGNDPQWYPTDGYITKPYVAYPKTAGKTEEVEYNENVSKEPSDHNDIILLPQGLSENATITVTYTMKMGDENNGSVAIPQTTTVKINTLTPEGWEIGKRYTYTIIFGLDRIYFAPEVETWTDVPATTGEDGKIEL